MTAIQSRMKQDAKYRPQGISPFRPTDNSPFGRHYRKTLRRYFYSSFFNFKNYLLNSSTVFHVMWGHSSFIS